MACWEEVKAIGCRTFVTAVGLTMLSVVVVVFLVGAAAFVSVLLALPSVVVSS